MNEEKQEGNRNEHKDSIAVWVSLVISQLEEYITSQNHIILHYNDEITNTTSWIESSDLFCPIPILLSTKYFDYISLSC